MEACQKDNIFMFYSREIYFKTVLIDFKMCLKAQTCFPFLQSDQGKRSLICSTEQNPNRVKSQCFPHTVPAEVENKTQPVLPL